MDNFFHKLKSIKLTASEKGEMRGKLLSMMKISAATRGLLGVPTYRELWFHGIFVFIGKRRNVLAGTFVLLILVSGGLSYAAAGALPGDILYPIKTSILEPIRGNLTFSTEAKVEWQTILAENRLVEVETLASQGKLDYVKSAQLDQEIKQTTTNFKNQLDNLKSSADSAVAAELSLKFESSLRAHERVISNLSSEDKKAVAKTAIAAPAAVKADSPSKDVISGIRSASRDIEKIRVKKENDLRGRSSNALKNVATNKLESVNSAFTDVTTLLSDRSASLAPSNLARIKDYLDTATSNIAQGKSELSGGKYLESFGSFQKAGQIMNQARILINAPMRAVKAQPSISEGSTMQTSQFKPESSMKSTSGWNYVFGSSTSDSEDDANDESTKESQLPNEVKDDSHDTVNVPEDKNQERQDTKIEVNLQNSKSE